MGRTYLALLLLVLAAGVQLREDDTKSVNPSSQLEHQLGEADLHPLDDLKLSVVRREAEPQEKKKPKKVKRGKKGKRKGTKSKVTRKNKGSKKGSKRSNKRKGSIKKGNRIEFQEMLFSPYLLRHTLPRLLSNTNFEAALRAFLLCNICSDPPM